MFRGSSHFLSINGSYRQLLLDELQKKREPRETPEVIEARKLDDKNDIDLARGFYRGFASVFSTIPAVGIEAYQNKDLFFPKEKTPWFNLGIMAARAYPYHVAINIPKSVLVFAGSSYLTQKFEIRNKAINNSKPPAKRLSDHQVHWNSLLWAFACAGAVEGFFNSFVAVVNVKYSLYNSQLPAGKPVISVGNFISTITPKEYWRSWRASVLIAISKDGSFWPWFMSCKKRGEEALGIKPNEESNPRTFLKEFFLGAFASMTVASTSGLLLNNIYKARIGNPSVTAYHQFKARWQVHHEDILQAAQNPKNTRLSAYFPHSLRIGYQMAKKDVYRKWWLYGGVRSIIMGSFTGGWYLIDKYYDANKGAYKKNNLFTVPVKLPNKTSVENTSSSPKP